MDYVSLQREIQAVGARVTGMLRAVPGGDQAVKGLDWTIGELGAHLVTVARRNIAVASGRSFTWDPGTSSHASMAAFNDEEIEELGEHRAGKLAELLDLENAAVLEALGADPGRHVVWPHYEARVHDTAGVWLGELLVHGLDLARTLERAWPIHAGQAVAVFEGLLPSLPVYVNRAKATSAAGRYHIHLRGDGDYGLDVQRDGMVSVTPDKPASPDLHVSADPVAYLLVGYGRANRWTAIARGAIVAWGRKPWLALRFPDLFERP